MVSYADSMRREKALGFLSACAYDKMMTNTCGQSAGGKLGKNR